MAGTKRWLLPESLWLLTVLANGHSAAAEVRLDQQKYVAAYVRHCEARIADVAALIEKYGNRIVDTTQTIPDLIDPGSCTGDTFYQMLNDASSIAQANATIATKGAAQALEDLLARLERFKKDHGVDSFMKRLEAGSDISTANVKALMNLARSEANADALKDLLAGQ